MAWDPSVKRESHQSNAAGRQRNPPKRVVWLAQRLHRRPRNDLSTSLRGGIADEAIQGRRASLSLDCFAALAMTAAERPARQYPGMREGAGAAGGSAMPGAADHGARRRRVAGRDADGAVAEE